MTPTIAEPPVMAKQDTKMIDVFILLFGIRMKRRFSNIRNIQKPAVVKSRIEQRCGMGRFIASSGCLESKGA